MCAVDTEQSNTTALVENRYVVKLYRKVEAGINVEIEVGRFLTEMARFTNTPAVLGAVELDRDNTTSAIAIVHELAENQGDGWVVTSGYLDRFVEEQSLVTTKAKVTGKSPISASCARSAGWRKCSRAPAVLMSKISGHCRHGEIPCSGPKASCAAPNVFSPSCPATSRWAMDRSAVDKLLSFEPCFVTD